MHRWGYGFILLHRNLLTEHRLPCLPAAVSLDCVTSFHGSGYQGLASACALDCAFFSFCSESIYSVGKGRS